MNMITEDYVNKEIARLLRDKGFDEPCDFIYDEDNLKWGFHAFIFFTDGGLATNSKLKDINGEIVTAPTVQMALKWLREVHKIEVRVTYDIEKTSWWGECNPMYEEDEENSNMFQSLLDFDYQGKTYEEACEATIKFALEHLI